MSGQRPPPARSPPSGQEDGAEPAPPPPLSSGPPPARPGGRFFLTPTPPGAGKAGTGPGGGVVGVPSEASSGSFWAVCAPPGTLSPRGGEAEVGGLPPAWVGHRGAGGRPVVPCPLCFIANSALLLTPRVCF